MEISKIILYDESRDSQLESTKIKKFLKETFPLEIEIKKNIISPLNQNLMKKISETRVYDLKKPFNRDGEIKQENFSSIENSNKEEKIIYDGFELCNILGELIAEDENKINILNIFLTDFLTGTFSEEDFRYHARAIVGANPMIISISGIVEAPAKPRQYYLDRMTNSMSGIEEDLNEKYKGEFLEFNDSRISSIVEGYVLQSILYLETGDPFCKYKHCRLYNAHWQKDLLFAQLESRKFCENHSKIIKRLQTS